MHKKEWETIHRWEWFRREQWLHTFRQEKFGSYGGSPAAVKRILGDAGGKVVLDASCGLGLKTVVMHEIALDVVGCDQSEFAIEKARELSRLEQHPLEFFTARWRELPSRTKMQFDLIFNDALSSIVTREDFELALNGFRGALKSGGYLVFMGAPEGSTPHDALAVLEATWEARPKFSIQWTHTEGDMRCTALLARDRREDYIDEHHLFIVEEGGEQRLETATIRQPIYWHWALLKDMFHRAGFSHLETREFCGMGKGGTDFTLNVATK
ncbi:MAG: class I SAM-dependent methyltransferase [Phycisphaerae bacterium]|nr:class I SAM-dependent methyltransferase [Phycisphaerae bacterium]